MHNFCQVTQTSSESDLPIYGRVRCAIYARFSSDNQNPVTIKDQVREARKYAARKGWEILEDHIYIDEDKTARTAVARFGLDALVVAVKSTPKVIDRVVVVDVSRLARRKADGHHVMDVFAYHQVFVTFIEDGLDSAEGSFDEAYNSKLSQASNYSKSLGLKVKRGREGRFIDGYNPGGGCYGYLNVPDEDPARKGLYGRPAVRGMLQHIDLEEAAIVTRIFEAFAAGMSYRATASMLNKDKIPTSQPSRGGKERTWRSTSIRTMIENQRYIGKLVYGVTTQVMNPDTGKYTRRPVPKHQWLLRDEPRLRIISDELWARVNQRRRVNLELGVQRLGGMNRTERSRKYVFSGCLRCGDCGANMTMTGSQPPRYGCSNRLRGGACLNSATILLELVESQFLGNLASSLRSPALREELVLALYEYLHREHGRAGMEGERAAQELCEMKSTVKALRLEELNLIRAVAENGHSRALFAGLEETEERIKRLVARIESATNKPVRPKATEEEVRQFVDQRSEYFIEMLRAEPEALRSFLQPYISEITLTPSCDEGGVLYSAFGDVGLFSATECPVQINQVHPIDLHWKIPVRFQVHCYKQRGRRRYRDAA